MRRDNNIRLLLNKKGRGFLGINPIKDTGIRPNKGINYPGAGNIEANRPQPEAVVHQEIVAVFVHPFKNKIRVFKDINQPYLEILVLCADIITNCLGSLKVAGPG